MQDKIGRLQLLIGQRKIEGHGQEKGCTTRLGRPHAGNSGDTTLAPPPPSSPSLKTSPPLERVCRKLTRAPREGDGEDFARKVEDGLRGEGARWPW